MKDFKPQRISRDRNNIEANKAIVFFLKLIELRCLFYSAHFRF